MSNVEIYLKALIRLMFSIIDVIFHQLFKLIYKNSSKKVPPITDLLLLDSATQIAFKIRTKKIKCIDVLESFIKRIESINPVTNCVVDDRYNDARIEAKRVDELLESNLISEDVLIRDKPFLGVPFTTKDCIAVKGMIHTAGLVLRKNRRAEEDAPSIHNLREAGAIPIALTNVSELAMWWESANWLHGRTRNPYNTSRIVGGSSGGEGCIQAAAGSAFGVGSDIGGSIRMPAFFNGIFGHKPSPYIVSNEGQYPPPASEEQESFLGIGPICRRSEDLLPLLKIMAGNKADTLKLNEQIKIKDIKIFYQEDSQGSIAISPVNKEIRSLFGKLVTYFDKAHQKSIEKLELKKFSLSAEIWLAGMKLKCGPKFQEQLTDLNGRLNVPLELLKWCLRTSNHTFIALCTALVENFGVKYGDPKYLEFMKIKNDLKEELINYLGDDGVFIYPTHPTVAPYHNEPIFKPLNFAYTGIINILGLPATHVPMGLNSEGLPLGFQVIAAPNNDRLCLTVACELEKAFGGWVPPQID